VGVGQRQAHLEDALAAVIRLGLALTEGDDELELPEVVPHDASALHELLAAWLEGQDEDEIREQIAQAVEAELEPIPQEPAVVSIAVEHDDDARGRVDELQPPLGPEGELTASAGSWGSTGGGEVTREVAAESTQTIDDGLLEPGADPESHGRRFQLLARILAPPENRPNPGRFQGKEGQVCQGIRERILEGRLDPLTFPGEIPGRSLAAVPTDEIRPGSVSVTRVTRARNTQVDLDPSATKPRRWGLRSAALAALLISFGVGMVVGSFLLWYLGI